jgi:hypothetical protein
MAEDYRVRTEPGFLHVRVAPATSQPAPLETTTRDFLTRIASEARDAGVTKVLVDARGVTGALSTMERFEYGELIAEVLSSLKVAFVLHPSLRDPNSFGETVAVNRGADFKTFTAAEEACDWLGVTPPGENNA